MESISPTHTCVLQICCLGCAVLEKALCVPVTTERADFSLLLQESLIGRLLWKRLQVQLGQVVGVEVPYCRHWEVAPVWPSPLVQNVGREEEVSYHGPITTFLASD